MKGRGKDTGAVELLRASKHHGASLCDAMFQNKPCGLSFSSSNTVPNPGLYPRAWRVLIPNLYGYDSITLNSLNYTPPPDPQQPHLLAVVGTAETVQRRKGRDLVEPYDTGTSNTNTNPHGHNWKSVLLI